MLYLYLYLHYRTLVTLPYNASKVRYFYESLHRLKPGVTLLALHGAMTQLKRTAIFHKFSAKQVCQV